jgi:ankyrin repeat protein
VIGGNCDIISFLLEKGSQMLCKDGQGNTPLHVACLKNDMLAIRIFINQKESKRLLRMQDKKGRTANHLCSGKYQKLAVEGVHSLT